MGAFVTGWLDRYLLAMLGLTAVAGILVMTLPGRESEGTGPLLEVPATIGAWHAEDGAPEEILPADPRALDAVRRTYRNGPHTVWLSISRYPGLNDPQTRPAVFELVPQRGWVSIKSDVVDVTANGHPGGRAARINRVVIQRPGQPLAILYWYRVAGKVVRSEYELRLRLFANTLLARPRPLLLVRVASDRPESAETLVTMLAGPLGYGEKDL